MMRYDNDHIETVLSGGIHDHLILLLLVELLLLSSFVSTLLLHGVPLGWRETVRDVAHREGRG